MNNETFTPQITELISEPDNIEKLRDRVAFILKGETQHQHALSHPRTGAWIETANSSTRKPPRLCRTLARVRGLKQTFQN